MVKTKQLPISPFRACFIEVLRVAIFFAMFYIMQGCSGDTITITAFIIAGAIGLIIPIILLKNRVNYLASAISLLVAVSPVLSWLYIANGNTQEMITGLLFTLSICCNLILSEIYFSKEGNKNIRVIFTCILAAFSSSEYIAVLLSEDTNNVYASLSGMLRAVFSLLIYVIVIIIRLVYSRSKKR